jgi:hypothetical protein
MAGHWNASFRDNLSGFELEEPHAAGNPSGRAASSLTAVLRSLILALLVLAALPAAGSAAVSKLALVPEGGVDYGDTQAVTGKVTGAFDAPLVGRQVVLEAHGYPFRRPYAPIATATTGLDGRFAFERRFDRNQRVRVLVPETGERSAFAPVYVFPPADLTFSLVKRNVIRIVQTYRTPTDIRLTAPTFFYVGRAGRRIASRAAKSTTRPLKRKGKRVPGRFRASADVRLPAAWKGRFRYASCFPYNAGMGNPELGCPKRRYKF